ncbi:kinase-like protein [Periconia macrospinosa]|uniref:Kinase-like protein n=1 Tax=Periconia macrospinosa TaxID=97972 RepID=A0A2V1E0R0_9PLEO|nr:kinase-like protein [Periconia macrospinosa]
MRRTPNHRPRREITSVDPYSLMDMDQINSPIDFTPTPESSLRRSRSRAAHQTLIPGPIFRRYNSDGFSGGPETPFSGKNGLIKPVNNRDTRTSSSSDASSAVYKVEDLGFSAAAGSFDFNSIKQEALCALRESQKTACVETNLRERFEECLKASEPTKDYLTLDEFRTIFNPSAIVLLLEERHPDSSELDLLNKFQKIISPNREDSRTRILGILVAMERLDYLEQFIKGDIWDRNLPFPELGGYTEKSSILSDWKRNERLLFYAHQKSFFVPFFDIQEDRLCSYKFFEGTRLPWVSLECMSRGSTGLVHQLEIHPSHHNFRKPGSDANPKFALKEIDASGQRAYRKELYALEKTCAHVQKENHLIKLLLTFQHGNTFYLLFECADGNLHDFWQSNPSMEHSLSNEIWAAQQCLGLAKAVSRIHGLSSWHKTILEKEDECVWGRHGDIKPDNILWFEEYGDCRRHLVISDLGLARYHTEFSKSLVPPGLIDGITWGYRAPEIDFGSSISQGYDIFSLGCVFLEFCIWYLQGADEVEIFEYERDHKDQPKFDNIRTDQFFCMTGDCNAVEDARLKNCVKERLAQMRKGTKFTQGMATVIEQEMLCCNPAQRAKIDLIRTGLQELVKTLTKSSTAQKTSHDSNPNPSTQLDKNNTLRKNPSHLTLGSPEESSSVDRRDDNGARSSQSNHEPKDSSSDYYIAIETFATIPSTVTKSEMRQAEMLKVSVTPSSHSIAEPQSPQQQPESVDIGEETIKRNSWSPTKMFRNARNKSNARGFKHCSRNRYLTSPALLNPGLRIYLDF